MCRYTHLLPMTREELQQQYLVSGAMLYGVALRLLGSSQDAEDAVQEVFLTLWNRSEMLQELEVEEGQRYFTQALKNHCISQLRRREVRRVADEAVEDVYNLQPDDTPSPYEQLAQNDELEQLAGLVATLPKKQAEAFRLCHFEQLDTHEIAGRMNETEANVRMLLSRARRTVKALFCKA